MVILKWPLLHPSFTQLLGSKSTYKIQVKLNLDAFKLRKQIRLKHLR